LSSAEGVLVDLILDLEAAMMIVMVMVLMMTVMMLMMMLMMMMMTIITKDSDLFWSICHIYCSIRYRPTHLPSHPLQRREEHTVDQCWLEVSEARSYIPGHTEVCILVYRTGDEARHLVVVAKGYTEGGREGRTCLDGRERALADVIRCCEPEDGLTLGHEDR